MKLRIAYNVKLPPTPAYLQLEGSSEKISIKTLDERALRQLGKAWTDELIRRAKDAGTVETVLAVAPASPRA